MHVVKIGGKGVCRLKKNNIASCSLRNQSYEVLSFVLSLLFTLYQSRICTPGLTTQMNLMLVVGATDVYQNPSKYTRAGLPVWSAQCQGHRRTQHRKDTHPVPNRNSNSWPRRESNPDHRDGRQELNSTNQATATDMKFNISPRCTIYWVYTYIMFQDLNVLFLSFMKFHNFIYWISSILILNTIINLLLKNYY